MNRLRRIIGNTLISLLGQVLTWISTLLLTIAYGRFLGDAKFGELYLAINFLALIGIPLNASFSNQIIRDVAQDPDKAPRYYSSFILLKLGIWPIVYALALFISWLLGYSVEVRILVGIVGIVQLSSAIGNTFTSLHYALERTVFPAVGSILEKGTSTLFGILLLKLGAGVQAMAVVMLCGSIISMIWQAAWFYHLAGTKFIIDLELLRVIIRTSLPFLLYAFLLTSYTSIDTILLSLLTNSAVVGWYGAGNRLFDTMNFLPQIVIAAVMYPVFSKLSTSTDAGLKLAIEKSTNFLLFCGVPIATLMIIAAPNIIGFLYGRADFFHAIPALQALAPGVIFLYVNYVLTTTLISKKEDRKIPVLAAIATVFNIGLNLVLIPLYLHIGAAIVSTLTEVLLTCIAFAFVPQQLRPFGSLKVGGKALAASLVMVVAIIPIHTSSIFVILPIATLVYLGATTLLGTIAREDYQAVYNAISRKVPQDSPTGQITQELEAVSSSGSAWPGHSVEPLWSTGSNLIPELASGLGIDGIPETPLTLSFHSDELSSDELEITEKRPKLQLKPKQQPLQAQVDRLRE